MITVKITMDDQGMFTVSSDSGMEEQGEMNSSPAEESGETKQASSLQDALMLVTRMFGQAQKKGGGMSMFDQGVQKAMPANGSMGNMGM